jgi:hypothetical protein
LSTNVEIAESSTLMREESESGSRLTLKEGSVKRIGVDSLKAALAAANMAVDGTSDGGSSSAGSDTRGTLGSVRMYPLSHTVRKQHSAGRSSGSTVSTLAESRPDLADLLKTIHAEGAAGSGFVTPPYV